jgi:hypothetical protein
MGYFNLRIDSDDLLLFLVFAQKSVSPDEASYKAGVWYRRGAEKLGF